MSDYSPIEITYLVRADDVTKNDDLMFRLTIRTLAFTIYKNMPKEQIIDILKSEAARLEQA